MAAKELRFRVAKAAFCGAFEFKDRSFVIPSQRSPGFEAYSNWIIRESGSKEVESKSLK
jgi:hypothetical protein